jgi:hypothetical protein
MRNGNDPSGAPRLHMWHQLFTELGNQPIQQPWPFTFDPDGQLANPLEIRIEFPAIGTTNHDTTLTFASNNDVTQLPNGVSLDNSIHNVICSHNDANIDHRYEHVSYQGGVNHANHTPVRVKVSGPNTPNGLLRIAMVKTKLAEAAERVAEERGRIMYDGSNTGQGWVYEVASNVIGALHPGRTGLVALQITELSNTYFVAGKAVYASQVAGGPEDLAIAATLVRDPLRRTFEHEVGHAMFLNHTHQSQEPSDPNFLHQNPLPGGMKNCIMHYAPTNSCDETDFFCAFCILKLWAWSFLETNPAGVVQPAHNRTIWYRSDYNQHPGVGPGPGIPPRPRGSHTANPVGPHPVYVP